MKKIVIKCCYCFAVYRLLTGFFIICVGWYTIQMYADLFAKLSSRNTIPTQLAKESGKASLIKFNIA